MNREILSQKKLFMMITIELFAMTSLILPAVIVGFSGTDGMSFLLIASGILFLLALNYVNCLKRHNKPLDDMVEREANHLVRMGIKAIYLFRFFIHGLFLTVLFVNLIQEVLLPGYQLAEILLPILLFLFFMSEKTFLVRGRIAEVLFPYIFLPLLLVLAFALTKLEYTGLTNQLWGTYGRSNVSQLFRSSYGVYGILLFYQPIEFILFLFPLTGKGSSPEEERGKVRVLGWACLFAVVINLLVYLVTIGMFGTAWTGEKLWSALYIMQSVRLPGKFVERLDILFLVFWIFGTLYLISSYLYYGSRFVCVEMGGLYTKKRRRLYQFLWIGTLFLLAVVIKEPRRIFEFFVPYKMWIDFPAGLLLPLFLYRKRGEKRKHSRKIIPIGMVVLCTLLLTGCENRADIEDKNYIMSIGIGAGSEKEYTFFYEIADLSKGNQESEGRRSRILKYEADSFQEAEELYKKREDKRLDYGHVKAILFSREVMIPGEQRTRILNELKKKNTIAGTVLLFFTDQVQKVMENGGKRGTSFGEYMDQMMVNQGVKTKEEDTLADFLRDEMEQRGDRPVFLLHTDGEEIVWNKEVLKGMIDSGKEERLTSWNERQLTGAEGGESPLAGEVLRFHIRANSDLPYDQSMKRKIKNQILPKLQSLLKDAKSKEESMAIVDESVTQINEWVQEACEKEQYPCTSQTYLCQESFPLKIYGDMVFPRGVYDALRIDLGEAEGKNWWCMMYPSLCLSEGVIEQVSDEGKEKLEESLSEEEYEEICLGKRENRFHVRWKILDVIKKLWEEKTCLEKKE